ncbi:MAG: ABC transporter substrate-binding protein [Deltaproteobacteria bacterium]|nr:ABC transporter substrate-binding protein [Deltaproteobacteria bacterium]
MKAIQSLAFFALMSLGLFPFFNHSSQALAVEPRKTDRLKAGYASVTGNRISLWAAHQKGFFARHGLQPELIFIATSAQGMPALISGEMSIFSGSPETAAQAAVRGAELVIIASNEPTQYKLIVQPTIKDAKDLKGRKIGIDRIGGSSYYATRRMLEKLGLKSGDVEFMQVPGGGSTRAAAFRSGTLSAVVTTIERLERAKIPYHVLADAIEMGIKIIGSSFITTRSFRDQNREAIQKFVRALVEAGHWVKDPKNREEVHRIYSRHLRTDDASVLELNYRLYVNPLPLFPYTDVEDLRLNISDLAESNPKLRELSLANFVDNSFIQRVQQEGVK